MIWQEYSLLNFLFKISMHFSVKFTQAANRFTGRDSTTCSNASYLISFISFSILQSVFAIHSGSFFDFFFILLVIFCYGFIYIANNSMDKPYWEIAKIKYQPNTIIMMPLLFPNRYIVYRGIRNMACLFVALSFGHVILFVVNLFSTRYASAVDNLSGFLFFVFVSSWYSSRFYYHRIYDSSLYSRTKEKIKNRQKQISFAPVGV